MSILKYLKESLEGINHKDYYLVERESDIKFMTWAKSVYNHMKRYSKQLDSKNKYINLAGEYIKFPPEGDDSATIVLKFGDFLPNNDIIFDIHSSSHVSDKPLECVFQIVDSGGCYYPNTATIAINTDFSLGTLHDHITQTRYNIIHELKHLIQSLHTQGRVNKHYDNEIKRKLKYKKDNTPYSYKTHPEIYNNLTDEINANISEVTMKIMSTHKSNIKTIGFDVFRKIFFKELSDYITDKNKNKISSRIYNIYQKIQNDEINIDDFDDSFMSYHDRLTHGRVDLNSELESNYGLSIGDSDIWDLVDWEKPKGELVKVKDIHNIIKLYEKYDTTIDKKLYDVGLYFSIMDGDESSFDYFISKGALVDFGWKTVDRSGSKSYNKNLYNKARSMSNDKTILKYNMEMNGYDFLDKSDNVDVQKFIDTFKKQELDMNFNKYALKLFDNNLNFTLLFTNNATKIIFSLLYDNVEFFVNRLMKLTKDNFTYFGITNGYTSLLELLSSLIDYTKEDTLIIYNKYEKLLDSLDGDDVLFKDEFTLFMKKFKSLIRNYES